MPAKRDDGIELGRRVHQRFAVEVEAEVRTATGSTRAITRDVSRGGACFIVQAPLDVGSSFEMALSLVLGENAFSEPLVIAGRVVWCTSTEEGYQIGAAFAPMAPEMKDYLQMFLSFLAKGVDVGDGEEPYEEEDDDVEEKGLFG